MPERAAQRDSPLFRLCVSFSAHLLKLSAHTVLLALPRKSAWLEGGGVDTSLFPGIRSHPALYFVVLLGENLRMRRISRHIFCSKV